jgi:hypothetical protein
MRHRELALGSALKLKAEQDRKAAMGRVADGFEQAIGIVQAVSSEIEVAAGNLNRTAEANNTLIVTASSASDRASENAQSAAAASERMASSVIEIGRQVQPRQPAAASPISAVVRPMRKRPRCRCTVLPARCRNRAMRSRSRSASSWKRSAPLKGPMASSEGRFHAPYSPFANRYSRLVSPRPSPRGAAR